MSPRAAATRRSATPAHHLRHQQHHPQVHQLAPHQWAWSCQCGGGIHDCTHALPDQGTAFAGATYHLLTNPGA